MIILAELCLSEKWAWFVRNREIRQCLNTYQTQCYSALSVGGQLFESYIWLGLTLFNWLSLCALWLGSIHKISILLKSITQNSSSNPRSNKHQMHYDYSHWSKSPFVSSKSVQGFSHQKWPNFLMFLRIRKLTKWTSFSVMIHKL